MISRKALLVSAPLSALNTGGNNDLEATRNFLLSPRGGAWAAHEIHVLENPTVEELTLAVATLQADYTITYFSGRSFADSAANRFLILKEDFIRDTDLLNASPKQLVLVDSCPETFGDVVLHFSGRPNEFELARKMYDRWIENCEPGQVIMHGRNSETTGDGAFTKALLQLAGKVPAVENRFNLRPIQTAGSTATGYWQSGELPVLPEISYSSGNVKLPFALALPAPPKGLPAAGTGAASGGMGAFTIALFLLSFLLTSE